MLERELKLYIPGNSMAALKQRMATLNPQSHTLRATYYDTPDRALAHAKAALRVRLENDVWVQTLKMAGPDELSKIELNHNLSHQALELEKFKNGPAYPLIKSVARELQPRYQTCVARQTARVKVGESLVEIALDEGVIKAGNSELSISEIEFELISGPVDALFEIGEAWLTDFQLILELRSKSERGDALAKFCARESLDADMTPAEALARRPYRLNTMSLVHSVTMQDCYANSASAYLTQVIRNAAFLSGIDNIRASAGQQASYLALMRVGMRRLRSCRRLFRPWMTHSEKNLAKKLRYYFSEFGEARDDDLLLLEVFPKLKKGGLTNTDSLVLPQRANFEPRRLAASGDFQLCLLHSLRLIVTGQSIVEGAPREPELYPILHGLLEQQLASIRVASASFGDLSHRRQHRLRNWIKTLRYCLEFLGTRSHRPLYNLLREAQRALGKVTDMDVAITWCRDSITEPEQRGYALGWLQATRDYKARQAAKILKELVNTHYPSYPAPTAIAALKSK